MTLNNAKLFKTYWQGDQEDAEEVIICSIGDLEIRLKGQKSFSLYRYNQETKSMPYLSQFGIMVAGNLKIVGEEGSSLSLSFNDSNTTFGVGILNTPTYVGPVDCQIENTHIDIQKYAG